MVAAPSLTPARSARAHPAVTVASRPTGGLRWGRVVGLSLFLAAVAGFLAYMVLEVPVAAPPLPDGRVVLYGPGLPFPLTRAQVTAHWWVAAAAALLVLAVAALAAVGARASTRSAPHGPLRLERVPLRAVAAVAMFSVALGLAGLDDGYPLWGIVLVALVPWVPLAGVEALWKYRRYGAWALFAVLVVAQLGHMAEHTVQVSQLVLSRGDLARSHGVFGQLDFETVHFVWDSALWIALICLLPRFGRGNPWLWVACVAASLHEVEHLYLFWLYREHFDLYTHGGFEGIMGAGGLIGSPLARPYMHFAYNVLVSTPMVLAFLDHSRGGSTGATREGRGPGAEVSAPV